MGRLSYESGALPVYDLGEVEGEDEFRWLVQGVWPHPSHGMLGGGEKTLKSYLSILLILCVASGRDFLGRFPTRTRGPVLVFTGEGRVTLWKRRARHLARGLGLSRDELDQLPIRLCDRVRPAISTEHKRTVEVELQRRPVLVVVDPLYTYVGSDHEAGNIFDMGSLLAQLNEPVSDSGSSLLIVHHLTKEGTRNGRPTLTELTQAGGREWVDSWLLVWHRQPADLHDGVFGLGLDVGSRQGGGGSWEVDLRLGPFDEETCRHTEVPTWEVRRPALQSSTRRTVEDVERAIHTVLYDEPWQLTKSEVANKVGGRREEVLRVIGSLAWVGAREETFTDSRGRRQTRRVWGLVGDASSDQPELATTGLKTTVPVPDAGSL